MEQMIDELNDEEEPPSGLVGQSSSSSASQSRTLVSSSHLEKRSKRSLMRNYFVIEKSDDGEERAYCKKCPKSYLWQPTSGTSNLKRHYEKCSLNVDVERKRVKFDDKIAREKFSRVIIRHNLPFLVVEYEELRDFHSYLNPDYKCYTRNTAAADVVKTWEKEKLRLRSELEKIHSRVCLTSDCWTTAYGDGYIVVTAHYVDAKWILNCKMDFE
ncbi:PREDICTED: zinc finger BED domain-containing protein DAYSLEEPER-like [Camelina sativa]|uniref:Zinc finger BED domain-containing protein DAYSLEEPER-like n=1 Tax=Camelina sativa TaxID=90675 RepID=A0ABM1QD02_CAMSA|nr:PREDICTED: zinc finger BED domain-containing protein DAYSLEEPER-like [Camelina sativa]